MGIEDAQTSTGSAKEGPINWQNYNYPPIIKVVHFSTDSLRQPFLSIAKKLHACAILVLAIQLINCKQKSLTL
jgi:hypothetical protein